MKRVLKILFLLYTMLLVAITASASSVTPIDLGTNSTAYGINNNGQIVGYCYNETTGFLHACYWDIGTQGETHSTLK